MKRNDMDAPMLRLGDLGGQPGFSVVTFRYHDGFSVGSGGASRVDISFRHRHPHFEIFWFRKGRGVIERDGDLIEVGSNCLMMLAPGDIHRWRETENLEGSLLAVSERFTSSSNFQLPFHELSSFLQPGGSRVIHLNSREAALMGSIFGAIQEAESPSSFERSEVLKGLLIILFSKIKGFSVGGAAPRAEDPSAAVTRAFRQALDVECPRLASVKEFAQLLGVSRSYLHRAVLRDTGQSPSDLIRDRLIFEAKRMLIHTNESSAEIARHLGFRSTSYFSSFFHRHTERTPRAFRSNPEA